MAKKRKPKLMYHENLRLDISWTDRQTKECLGAFESDPMTVLAVWEMLRAYSPPYIIQVLNIDNYEKVTLTEVRNLVKQEKEYWDVST